jgi:hypothetical protein
MPATIRIKRRAAGGSAGSPASLANAELAYNESDSGGGILYYGFGSSGEFGTATSIVAVAGPGAYLGLSNSLTQTAAGTYTFSGGVTYSSTVSLGASATATTPATSDNSTTVATTAYVKAQNYITGNQSVTISGDVTGSGSTSITATIANDAVTNAKLANMATATIKGRASAGTGDPEDLSASSVKTLLAITKSDISDFDTGVRSSRLDQMASPTASVSMNSQKITNLATPTDANDAVNKAYCDAARSGLDVKQSVRAATTATVDLSSELENGDVIDGVTLATGDRVLVKNNTTGSQNGIYVVQATGAAVRATDFDSADEVSPGAFVFIEEGTTNADSGWVLTTDGTITLGTTSLAFAQFSGAGQVVAGDGLTKSANTLNVVGTADRITANSDSIDIASTYAGQSSITTLGTVSTGTWNATAISVAKGGTALTSAPKGSVLVANAVDTYTALDGGGSADGILLYTASSDTIAWATSLDGGVF